MADLSRMSNVPYVVVDLSEANLAGAYLTHANLSEANLYRANLTKADLTGTNLALANLARATLRGASVHGAKLFAVNLSGADLSGAWDPKLDGAKQHDLVINRAWVLDPIAYGSVEELVQGLDEEIIKPALARFDELVVKKAEKLRIRHIA